MGSEKKERDVSRTDAVRKQHLDFQKKKHNTGQGTSGSGSPAGLLDAYKEYGCAVDEARNKKEGKGVAVDSREGEKIKKERQKGRNGKDKEGEDEVERKGEKQTKMDTKRKYASYKETASTKDCRDSPLTHDASAHPLLLFPFSKGVPPLFLPCTESLDRGPGLTCSGHGEAARSQRPGMGVWSGPFGAVFWSFPPFRLCQ